MNENSPKNSRALYSKESINVQIIKVFQGLFCAFLSEQTPTITMYIICYMVRSTESNIKQNFENLGNETPGLRNFLAATDFPMPVKK